MTNYDLEGEVERVRLAIEDSFILSEKVARAALNASCLPKELERAENKIEELEKKIAAGAMVFNLLLSSARKRPALAKELNRLEFDLIPIIERFNN